MRTKKASRRAGLTLLASSILSLTIPISNLTAMGSGTCAAGGSDVTGPIIGAIAVVGGVAAFTIPKHPPKGRMYDPATPPDMPSRPTIPMPKDKPPTQLVNGPETPPFQLPPQPEPPREELAPLPPPVQPPLTGPQVPTSPNAPSPPVILHPPLPPAPPPAPNPGGGPGASDGPGGTPKLPVPQAPPVGPEPANGPPPPDAAVPPPGRLPLDVRGRRKPPFSPLNPLLNPPRRGGGFSSNEVRKRVKHHKHHGKKRHKHPKLRHIGHAATSGTMPQPH